MKDCVTNLFDILHQVRNRLSLKIPAAMKTIKSVGKMCASYRANIRTLEKYCVNPHYVNEDGNKKFKSSETVSYREMDDSVVLRLILYSCNPSE
ncbi:hypothetical protein TSAR_001721 [Trichomalopsis sarcophagae]|uniref:Uncharacterized protein n=1 Tax=Trichomalopsis sarcophagae TaxID=543379 RepID=A0A232ET56_9HYME|nr:hypothetical protein TSAR_001721 [Trichomalopsis sarcophagae]